MTEEEDKKDELFKQYKLPKLTYLYHATSGPIDHYEGYRPMLMLGYDVYKEEMKSNLPYYPSARDKMDRFNRLLFQVIEHFHEAFKMPRGEQIYYRFDYKNYENVYAIVIMFKEDNNGTMHAFSTSSKALINAPHEFDDEWEIEDRAQI